MPDHDGFIIPHAKDDQEAYRLNPKLRWVYHKPLLYDRLSVEYGLFPALPRTYPVVVKPSVNLYGLARGAQIAHSNDDIANAPGCLWMPLSQGQHWSVDVKIHAPNNLALTTVQGIPHPRFGLFSYWMHADLPTEQEARVHEVVRLLGIRCGEINVELIGSTPIEVHLRLSDEFGYLCTGKALYARPLLEPFRISITEDQLTKNLDGYVHTSCVTGDDLPEYAAPGWYRYAIVYGDDLARLKQARPF